MVSRPSTWNRKQRRRRGTAIRRSRRYGRLARGPTGSRSAGGIATLAMVLAELQLSGAWQPSRLGAPLRGALHREAAEPVGHILRTPHHPTKADCPEDVEDGRRDAGSLSRPSRRVDPRREADREETRPREQTEPIDPSWKSLSPEAKARCHDQPDPNQSQRPRRPTAVRVARQHFHHVEDLHDDQPERTHRSPEADEEAPGG